MYISTHIYIHHTPHSEILFLRSISLDQKRQKEKERKNKTTTVKFLTVDIIFRESFSHYIHIHIYIIFFVEKQGKEKLPHIHNPPETNIHIFIHRIYII